MSTAMSYQLTVRVSGETKVAFDAQRKVMDLSKNQFLKFLILASQGKVDEFIRENGPMPTAGEDLDEHEHQRLSDWLRGK